eukprot:scaffold14120_cov21-Tisochrysis_lutea.AAC.1
MRGGGRLAAGVSSPMRDGRRAAAVLGGGGRGARCGSTANAMVDVEVMGEPLQSIDKLPSWAAGSLSPARGGRMAQAVNAAEEALVPSLSRCARTYRCTGLRGKTTSQNAGQLGFMLREQRGVKRCSGTYGGSRWRRR